jgi:putative endonuclease
MSYLNIANLGEDFVAQWLQSTGWMILQRQFSCRWGEIDIIAQHTENVREPTLVFVEVKTRSLGSWDDGGRGAITLKKQAKIERTARIFLAEYPEKSNYTCRFDVAIVSYEIASKNNRQLPVTQEPIAVCSVGEYKFQLQEYIPAAFECL